jgi:hypothetical protein
MAAPPAVVTVIFAAMAPARAVRSAIETRFGAFETRHARGPGDTPHAARDLAAGGAQVAIAGGGDGTVSEVADGHFVSIASLGVSGAIDRAVNGPDGFLLIAATHRKKTVQHGRDGSTVFGENALDFPLLTSMYRESIAAEHGACPPARKPTPGSCR